MTTQAIKITIRTTKLLQAHLTKTTAPSIVSHSTLPVAVSGVLLFLIDEVFTDWTENFFWVVLDLEELGR